MNSGTVTNKYSSPEGSNPGMAGSVTVAVVSPIWKDAKEALDSNKVGLANSFHPPAPLLVDDVIPATIRFAPRWPNAAALPEVVNVSAPRMMGSVAARPDSTARALMTRVGSWKRSHTRDREKETWPV